MHRIRHPIRWFAAVFCAFAAGASAQEPPPTMAVLISIADQRLVVLREGGVIHKYTISTSRFGAGDAYNSYKTPLGQLRVCDKVGDDLALGSVIKHRSATGEVLEVNAPGRDPIVTRILWLDGLEEQNRNARSRGIYIHGTPEEKKIGQPVSWGCIRMRSRDVAEIFDEIPVGTPVHISAERLPKLHKYEPPKPVIIASRVPARTPSATPAPAPKQIASNALAVPPNLAATKTPAKSAPAAAPMPDTPSAFASNSSEKGTTARAKAFVVKRLESLDEIAQAPRNARDFPTHPDHGALAAMKGSILFAGLPDGPTAKSILTEDPKTLVRAAPLGAGVAADLNPQ